MSVFHQLSNLYGCVSQGAWFLIVLCIMIILHSWIFGLKNRIWLVNELRIPIFFDNMSIHEQYLPHWSMALFLTYLFAVVELK